MNSADGMKFGIFGLHRGGNAEPEPLARGARLAEEAGFESIWVGDHVALPYGGEQAYGADEPRLEAVVALAYLAAVTTRIGLGVGVLVLPQRQPVLLAKQLASVDVLTAGRLIVGVGVGYVEPELNAFGVSLADRGAMTDEYLAAMHAVWDESSPDFAGRFVRFAGVRQRPLPVQRPRPPIVVGGSSAAAYRRAVVSGNGFYGWDLDVDDTAAALAEIRTMVDRHDRPAELGDLEITITPPGTLDLDTARRYADLGVHRLLLRPSGSEPAAAETLIATTADALIGRV